MKGRRITTALNSALVVAFAAFGLLSLSGCNGEAEITPAPPSNQVEVGVDVSGDIPGTSIGTTTDGTSPLVGGSGKTRLQLQQVQVVTVFDPNNQARGIGLGGPSPRVNITPRSTAASLVFLTPGIATTDPTIGAQRMQAITSLSTFPAFESYFSARIGTMTVEQILAETEAQNLLATVVEEFTSSAPSLENIEIVGDSSAGGVGLGVQSIAGGGNLLEFVNAKWRYTGIIEEAFKTEQRLTPTWMGDVPGMRSFIPGDVFGHDGTAGGASFETTVGKNGVTEAYLLVVGLGSGEEAPLTEDMPMGGVRRVRLFSMLDYTMIPVVSVLTGLTAEQLAGVRPALDGSPAVHAAMNDVYAAFQIESGREPAVAAATRSLMNASTTVMVDYLQAEGLIDKAQGLAIFNRLMSQQNLLLTQSNLIPAVRQFSAMPGVARLHIRVEGSGVKATRAGSSSEKPLPSR